MDNSQDSIDIKAIFGKIVAHWWLFAIAVVLFGAMAVVYLKTTPKRFAVSGVMLMSEKKRNSFGSNDQEFLKGSTFLRSGGELEDQISILMSFATVRHAIDKLDFGVTYWAERNFKRQEVYGRKPFVVRPDTSHRVIDVMLELVPDRASGTYTVRGKAKNVYVYDPVADQNVEGFLPRFEVDATVAMGQPFRSEYLNFTVDFPADYTYPDGVRYYFMLHSPEGLTSAWRGATLTSPQSDESNIIILTTTGEVVKKQQDFINTLMETYIELEQAKHNEKGRRTIGFIDGQLSESGVTLTKAEQVLQEAQSSGGILMGSAGERSTSIFNEISRLEDQRGRLQSNLQSLTEMVSRMNSDDGTGINTISVANVDAPALTSLVQSYNSDVAELVKRRATEKQLSPATTLLARKVQTSKTQIIQMATDVRRQVQLELEQRNSRIGSLRHQMNQLPKDNRQVTIAERGFAVSSEMNTYLMEKRYEAQIAVASDQVDKYVVDVARMAGLGPVAPDKKVALGGAILLGLLLPLLYIIIRDFFNDKIADIDELRRLSPIPVLATIPTSKARRIDPENGRSLMAESFRTARINLQYLNAHVARQVVGLTSSTSGEGKTFCSINLATVMALSGKRTLLIDADMRRPRVHEYLEVPAGVGLSTYLIGEVPLEKAIRPSDVPGLDVITAGPIPPNPLELMESPRLAELFAAMRGKYDQIVVDASPMGLVSEFKVVLHHIDVSLYVVRQGYTRRHMLRHVNELAREGKITNIDLLLNDVKAEDGYGYYQATK